jgi:hypothetical protein
MIFSRRLTGEPEADAAAEADQLKLRRIVGLKPLDFAREMNYLITTVQN